MSFLTAFFAATRGHPRVAVFALAALAPLGLVALSSPIPGRGFVIELGSALGIVALSLLALQLMLPARLGAVAIALGADVAVRLHRHLADVLVAAVAGHVALVIADDLSQVVLLNPVGAPWRAQAAVAATVALAALIASSLLRRHLPLSYARWRGLHVALGVSALLLGAAHAVGVDRHLTHGPAGVALAGLTALALAAVIELRVLRPRRLARRAYVVERVEPERGGATTLALRADGHAGHRFRPGQFAWLKLGHFPHALAEHPFSYASSATRPGRPQFTIKAYCGFSRHVPHLAPGTRVLLDGPHGSFKPSHRADGFVLIAGGIGVTPIMSMLRTAADAGDRRPHLLLYGSVRWEDAIFREELERLAGRLPLRVVHVLERPPAGWTGETGFVDAAVLDRHLPRELRHTSLFLCGPPPMLQGVLRALERVGIPPERTHAEQFVTV